MEIKTTEFFKNIKSLPPPGTDEFRQLISWEEEKIKGGVTVNGVYFSGWLYWHLNHWWIRIDEEDEFGNGVRKPSLPDLRDNEWIRAETLEKCRVEKSGYIEVGGRQGGKDLLNSSLLYTQDGEITIGECNVGDRIYDDSGKLTTIKGKFPQGIKPVYKISLVDGRELYCGLEHNWKVYHRKSKKTVVKTTSEMLKDFRRERPDWKGQRKNSYEFRYSIPNNQPVEYPEKILPIDPYILGLWLGDGSNHYSKITSVDQEIIDTIYNYASQIGMQVTIDDIDTFMITSGSTGGSRLSMKDKNPFHKSLIDLNLYKNKHIPAVYLHSSMEQRMELLRGLMDTDGSCCKNGKIEFSSTDKQLAEDFYKLCRGLGINLSKTNKQCSYRKNGIKIECKDTTRFILYTDKKIFKLSRKLNNIKRVPKYLNYTAIQNIEYVFDAETTCIVVDNDSHLFLTDNYTITHNSEMEASFFGMNAIMFRDTQNVIVCGNDNDLSLIKDKVDFGLKHLWEGISIPRLDKTWRSNQVRLGYKITDGEDDIWSYIVIRNAKDGHNTEVAAGTTAKSFIMDEIGKYSFASAFKAAEPALKGKYGFRAIPILVGTGGSFDNGEDAENLFYNPSANNFLEITDEKTGKKTGLFLSGLYRQDCKYKTTLDKWLSEEKGISLKNKRELSKIEIWVSDKDKARKLIEKEREDAKKNPDRTLYLKQVMYYPLEVDECFLSVSENIFDVEAARRQKARLLANERTGTPVILVHDGEKIVHQFTDKLPISNFPLKHDDDKDAPVVIYEFPIENPPYGLYVAGVDPYRQGQSSYSSSLGSVYIYKRMHSLFGEKYQDMFVASYCARPDKKEKWEEQARLLIKYYNARTLCENDEISFIEYMKAKGDAHLLERQPEWLKEIVPNTTVSREYGIHRSAQKIIDYLHSCMKKYMEETVYKETAEDGSVIREVTGITRILDPLLLEEIAKYDDTGNFDRVVAAELAIAQALKMDPIFGPAGTPDSRVASLYKKGKKKQLFGPSRGLFTKRHKLFT